MCFWGLFLQVCCPFFIKNIHFFAFDIKSESTDVKQGWPLNKQIKNKNPGKFLHQPGFSLLKTSIPSGVWPAANHNVNNNDLCIQHGAKVSEGIDIGKPPTAPWVLFVIANDTCSRRNGSFQLLF
ncbi:MAG: hypothetical protein IPL65_08455 [Lewinellaceae bacterium]|nr:hypothetical protein [Lewinellaceae bacterium]